MSERALKREFKLAAKLKFIVICLSVVAFS